MGGDAVYAGSFEAAAGEFLGEYVVSGKAAPTPAGFAFSVDPAQKYLYVVESANARVLIFER